MKKLSVTKKLIAAVAVFAATLFLACETLVPDELGFNPDTMDRNRDECSEYSKALVENVWGNGVYSQTAWGNSEEWFTFTATAATQYIHFRRDPVGYQYIGEIHVQIYNNSCNKVGSSSRLFGWGSDLYTTRSLTIGETYYIMASAAYSYNGGTYQIAINSSSTPPGTGGGGDNNNNNNDGDPTCTAGENCPDDEGYCGTSCVESKRYTCANGTLFSQTKPAGCPVDPNTVVIGSMDDPRDNQSYRTVTIGSKTWMAENLNFNAAGSWCYGNNISNCDTYGRLYDWNTAMSVCPAGWHLPSNDEWNELVDAVGGSSTAGTKLKSSTGWDYSGNGTDDYGFSALPGGSRWGSSFNAIGDYGYWWSATEGSTVYARNRDMNSSNSNVGSYSNDKTYGFSVRCVKD